MPAECVEPDRPEGLAFCLTADRPRCGTPYPKRAERTRDETGHTGLVSREHSSEDALLNTMGRDGEIPSGVNLSRPGKVARETPKGDTLAKSQGNDHSWLGPRGVDGRFPSGNAPSKPAVKGVDRDISSQSTLSKPESRGVDREVHGRSTLSKPKAWANASALGPMGSQA